MENGDGFFGEGNHASHIKKDLYHEEERDILVYVSAQTHLTLDISYSGFVSSDHWKLLKQNTITMMPAICPIPHLEENLKRTLQNDYLTTYFLKKNAMRRVFWGRDFLNFLFISMKF